MVIRSIILIHFASIRIYPPVPPWIMLLLITLPALLPIILIHAGYVTRIMALEPALLIRFFIAPCRIMTVRHIVVPPAARARRLPWGRYIWERPIALLILILLHLIQQPGFPSPSKIALIMLYQLVIQQAFQQTLPIIPKSSFPEALCRYKRPSKDLLISASYLI